MFDLHDGHDLRLPDWGPYTKQYMGISHIPRRPCPDPHDGLRFDLAVIPGFYRRKVDVPNVMWESGYHPWEAAPDLRYYAHRHELEWKDRVYVDVAFAAIDEQTRLVRAHCVNRTDDPQVLVLHYMASLHYPPLRPYSSEPIRPGVPDLPDGACWIDALDYQRLDLVHAHPTDSLVPDGRLRGEVRDHGFVGGSGLGERFSTGAGDTAAYRFALERPLQSAVLLVRFRMRSGGQALVHLSGLVDQQVALAGDRGLGIVAVGVGPVSAGEHELALRFHEGAAIDLDGFVLLEAEDVTRVRFALADIDPVPEILPGPLDNSLLLEYRATDTYYGLAWAYRQFQVREFRTTELDRFMRHTVHHHTRDVLGDSDEGHYTNVFLRPITLAPHTDQTIYGLVCCGDWAAVEARLASADLSPEAAEAIYVRERARRWAPSSGAGEPFHTGQERLATTVLTNVVYPVYCRRTHIRHNTPGRWWDSLYTWDSGFIALSLAELDLARAVDCLSAYLMPEGDPHSAFLHHGSPVPVQFYAFLELWNRTQSRELLRFAYPRLRQYHRFLAGRLGSSTTRALPSNLLKTWDYFYNSGGWDDYPPQVHVHAHALEDRVTPVITSAQVIRTAKILTLAAETLGEAGDLDEYRDDIETLTSALQTHAWDEDAGYYGYVVHDTAGRPEGILRHASGANYNLGLDGLYPLVAGIGHPEQRQRLIAHLRPGAGCFTDIGLCAVDPQAPYYRNDGYWNGTVWMAHQWFFWKALLDHGEDELAWQVARTALEVWQREVERSYNCFEHFVVETGRGAGWHHFGGLSSPVLNWYAAYYKPGRLTVGHDVWVERTTFDDGARRLEAALHRHPDAAGQEAVVLVTLQPGGAYRATWNGVSVPVRETVPGALAVRLPADAGRGTLVVAR